jgi:nucleotide-binding universal stress UspA family protein
MDIFTRGIMYKKILVPYDKCKAADKALKHALNLAEYVGSEELHILHVVEEFDLPSLMTRYPPLSITGEEMGSREYLKELYQGMKVGAMEMLEEVRDKIHQQSPSKRVGRKKQTLPTLQPVRIIVKVLLGRPPDKIVEYAKQEGLDLIVIGNVCLTGISRIKSLGSVSREVSERSPCPVLIVH